MPVGLLISLLLTARAITSMSARLDDLWAATMEGLKFETIGGYLFSLVISKYIACSVKRRRLSKPDTRKIQVYPI